ncbi:MAG: ATP-binding protein [Planctomycetota bacterium]|nr:MAG: ATP-binding protein [Planctomycetota bacterium]RKY13263.1 MAG: ATP-binding protein [Planctomycetota bacterium]
MTETQHILHKSWQLKSAEREVKKVSAEVLKTLEDHDFGEDMVFAVHLSLEEAFVNAIKHGNHGDPRKKILVECLITPEKIDISITDEGFGFDPHGVPDPRCNGNLYKSCGRGVLLIQSYMDVVEYNGRGNCVHMVKYRNGEKIPTPEKKCS